jgi:hypothetical protein
LTNGPSGNHARVAEISDQLVRLEEESWTALSSGPDAARTFFERFLDDDVVMLFPGGMEMHDRDAILDSIGDQPWSWFKIESTHAIVLSETAAILTYRATAQREGEEQYAALVSSGYRNTTGSWRLCFHQQTPL